jgi:NADH:ubiquinone oxidoreductase subunit 6 (subunit J)
LPIFCLGVFLSFAAHWFLVQIEGDIAAQIMVSVVGIMTMVTAAWILDRFKALPDHFALPKIATPGSA